MNKNMVSRIAVALVAIPSILWICYQGGDWLAGMILCFAFIAYQEFLYRENIRPKQFIFWFVSIFFVCFVLMNYSILGSDTDYCFGVKYSVVQWSGIIFLLVTGMIYSLGKEPPELLFSNYIRLVWGTFYIGLLYPFVLHVGSVRIWMPEISGGDWLLFLFAILWVGDSMALFIGKALGKHKLAPSVSPNKTIEGFVGGLLGAILVGVVMYFWKFNIIAWYHILLIAFGCSVFGQLGDLVESMWKRSLNIKDSSNLIPGHGGILDRFDSLLFAAPFMYLYLMQIYPL